VFFETRCTVIKAYRSTMLHIRREADTHSYTNLTLTIAISYSIRKTHKKQFTCIINFSRERVSQSGMINSKTSTD